MEAKFILKEILRRKMNVNLSVCVNESLTPQIHFQLCSMDSIAFRGMTTDF